MNVYNLVLEVTRNCNLRCPHCLRGQARRVRMSRQVLTLAVTGCDFASVTFTGGEPSLGVEVIEDFIDLCRWRNIRFNYFYIVTNGHRHNRYGRFLKSCQTLYDRADEQDMCSLEISRDQFHDYDKKLLWKFQDENYGEYPVWFHPENRTEYIENVIDEGMAHLNGLGSKERPEQKPWEIDRFDNVTEAEVYVSANGNVVSCCDMSYARIDAEAKGNVLKTPLSQIIESYCVKEEQEEAA